ncbi:hypothetical protein PSP20601_04971 [Pandoraea sputorum]|nr:hypothetical protein PSP20601_04971 [Pandoraea sputorum]
MGLIQSVPRSGPTVPVSASGHDARHSALATLDFNDPRAVQAAQLELAQTPGLDDFCGKAFDGADLEKIRNARAALILHTWAEQGEQSTASIEQSREHALKTLADHLSPTGQDALWRSLGENPEDHEFSQYFAGPDRLRLAGQVYRKQTDARVPALPDEPAVPTHGTRTNAWAQLAAILSAHTEACEQLIKIFEGAAQANTPDGRHRQAAETFAAIAQVYTQAGEHKQAAKAAWKAAEAYTQARLHQHATRAYQMAARAFAQAQLPERAAATYMQIARTCTADQPPAHTAAAYETAADAYLLIGLPGHAADAYETAAKFYAQAGSDAHATRAREKAVGAHKAVAQNCIANAQTLQAPNAYQSAVAAYQRAADVWAQARLPERAAAIYEQAANAFMQVGLHQQAAEFFNTAVYVYTKAQLPGQAAQACKGLADTYGRLAEGYLWNNNFDQAARVYLECVTAYERAGLPAQVADANTVVADMYLMAARAHLQANPARPQLAKQAFGKAATHYRLAEAIYTRAGQNDHAKAARTAADSCLTGQDLADHNMPVNSLDVAALTPLLFLRINKAIDARKKGLASEHTDTDQQQDEGITSGTCSLRMDHRQDPVTLEEFDPSKRQEYCLVPRSRQPLIYDVVTVTTAVDIIQHWGGRHPFTRFVFTLQDVVRGPRVLALLLGAPEDPPEASEAGTDEPIPALGDNNTSKSPA